MDALRKKSALIRLPQEKRAMVKQVRDVIKTLVDQGKPPGPVTISKKLRWDVQKVYDILQLSNQVVSMDDNNGLGEIIHLTSHSSPESQPEKQMLTKDLTKIIQYCMELISDDKERLAFVAIEQNNMTLKNLAFLLACSIETARQKNISAKESMKSCLKKHGWDLT